MRFRVLVLLVAALALPTGMALAKKPATKSQSKEIYGGLPKSIRGQYGLSCWAFTVSTADDTWAYGSVPRFSKTCRFRGALIPRYYLHEGKHGWSTKVSGSGFTCRDFTRAGMPKKVIRDLDGRKC